MSTPYERSLERKFQGEIVIPELRARFPGCVILKNDPNYLQGFPDLLVLHHHHWAALEVKAYADASHRPNQDYYIDLLHTLSYASFIYPENKEVVFDELQQAFAIKRDARVSKRK